MTESNPSTFAPVGSGWLHDNEKSKIAAVYQSKSACFSDLVHLAGLNPSVDFRFADLTGVDFTGSDLRGYNFVGANLSYSSWRNATWDATTNLEGALLNGAKGYGSHGSGTSPVDQAFRSSRGVTENGTAEVLEELRQAVGYLDKAPCGFFSVIPNGDIVYVNATLAKWLDYDIAQIGSGGLKLTDILAGDEVLLPKWTVGAPGEIKNQIFEVDLTMRSGTTVPVQLHHQVEFGAEGAPEPSRTLVILMSRDGRSDGKRATAEVDFKRFFDRTLDQLSSGVAVFDGQRRLAFYNDSYRRLWKLDRTFLDSNPDDSSVLYELRAARRLPERLDFRVWKAQLHKAYGATETAKDTWYLPDGRALSVVITPNPDGGVTYLFDDVTESLELARRFDGMIHFQRETLNGLAEGVAVFGSNGKARLFNPAFLRMWKLSNDAMRKEPHIQTVEGWCQPLFDDPAVWRQIRETITSIENRADVPLKLERKDGSVLDGMIRPLPDGATMLTFQEVTETENVERALRERNEALEAADRTKVDFVHHVSYELRSPLTTIIGFAHFLSDPSTGPLTPKQAEYLDYVTKSTNALLALTNNIFDLANIDAGAMKLELGPVDVSKTIELAAEGLQDRLATDRIRLKVEIAPDVGSFIGDEKRVVQVLYNLLANAVGFSPQDSTVGISARRTERSVVFVVTDSGPGIPADMKDKVFNWFESRSQGSPHRGAGLGLSLVRSFVELHGGTVSVASEVGKGTAITCELPFSRATIGPEMDEIPNSDDASNGVEPAIVERAGVIESENAISAMPPGFDGLIGLSHRDSVDIKPALLRLLTDQYTQVEAHSSEEEQKFIELASQLLDQVDEKTLAAVQKRLKNYPATPAEIKEKLARWDREPEAY